MSNPFDQFDVVQQNDQQQAQGEQLSSQRNDPKSDNPFDQFDHPPEAAVQQKQESSFTDKMMEGFMDMTDAFNGETRKFVNGELQLLLKGAKAVGIPTGDTEQKLAQDTAQYTKLADTASARSPGWSGVGTVLGAVGNVAQTAAQGAGIGGGLAKAAGMEAGAGVGSSIAGVTGQGANAAGRLGYVAGLTGAEQGLEYGSAPQRADKAIGGALGASVGQIGAEGVGLAARSLINKMGGIRKPIQEAITNGTDMTLGQATGNEKVQGLESFLSDIPLIGTKSGMGKAAQATDNIANNTLEQLGVGKNDSSELASQWYKGVQDKYKTATNITNKAYNNAFTIGEMEGGRVPLTATQEAVQSATDSIMHLVKDEGISSAAPASNVGQLLSDLAGKEDISPKGFDSLRKKISANINTLSNTDKEAANALSTIKDAMNNDLTSVSAQGSEFGNALNFAQDTYKQFKAPFQSNDILKQIIDPMNAKSPEDLFSKGLQNNKQMRVDTLLNATTDEGKQAFSTGLVQKAADASMTPHADGDVLDLNKLLTNIHKLGSSTKSLPNNYKYAIDGLKDVLARSSHVIEGAKPSSKLSHTAIGTAGAIGGMAGGSFALGSGLGLVAAAAAGPAIKGISMALTNPSVVRQLVRLGQGSLTKEAAEATRNFILKKTIIPALANSRHD